MNRQLIQLLYVTPEKGKEWPSLKDWIYSLLFILFWLGLFNLGSGL